ncbi:SRPBCC family protein [Actinocorallia populi]|uniref:SRPBCC family protein n=1 Tax=Actinocorallia populi TaxID=2079200 RepID=UPI0013009339|nr:SRPBCC family protein [Actinocorallia populi]
MAILTVSAELTAPPERLWRLLQRFDRYHEWLAVHDSFPEPPETPPRAGDAFVQCVTVLGMTGELHWTFEEVLPARLAVLETRLTARARLRASFRLEPEGGGTLMTCRYEVSGGRAGGVLVRVAGAEARSQTRAALAALDLLAADGRPRGLEAAG